MSALWRKKATDPEESAVNTDGEESMDKNKVTTNAKPWYRRNPFKSKHPPPVPADRTISNEKTANFFSQITFWYMNDLMKTGFNRELELNDLPYLPEQRRTPNLTDALIKEFKRRSEKGQKHALLRALNNVFFWEWWMCGFCRVITDILSVMSPFMLKYLITFASDAYYGRPQPISHGIGLAIGLLLMQITWSICMSQFMYRGNMTGGQARAALTSMIFRKALVISSRGRNEQTKEDNTKSNSEKGKKASAKDQSNSGWSNGRVVNLMSTDCRRIDLAGAYAHAIWSSIVLLILTLVLLLINLGYSAIPGYALILVISPALAYVVKLIARRRRSVSVITDKRVSLTFEVLSAVRAVKYFTWEAPYLKQIDALRVKEMRGIQVLLGLRNAVNAVGITVPVMASSLSFITYSLTHTRLNAASVFSSLALFNALRLPLNLLPQVVAVTIEAWIALARLEEYLSAEELSDHMISDEKVDGLEIRNGDFTWEEVKKKDSVVTAKAKGRQTKADKETLMTIPSVSSTEKKQSDADKPFQLRDINLSIGKGELIAVVGTVGSGKSSLLAALAGEMRKTGGAVYRDPGSTAYCPQNPWIQNASVRENITFCKGFNQAFYDQVIEACALKADMEIFPDGDLTEVGERGITISGGQKQRLNVARAIYFQADLVLMDDPLSAVDAQVGKHLFEQAICGLLKDRCRILATHQLHVIHRCDRVVWMADGTIRAVGTFEELMKEDAEFRDMVGVIATEIEQHIPAQPVLLDDIADEEVDSAVPSEKGNKANVEAIRLPAAVLMQTEEKAQSSVKWSVYLSYIRASGSLLVAPAILLLIFVGMATSMMNTVWLGWWTSDRYGLPLGEYIGIYVALAILQSIFVFAFGIALTIAGTRASRKLLQVAMNRVLRTPMSFFDTTPLGRIVNRFSSDIDVMDNRLTDAIRMYLSLLTNIVAVYILVIVYFPYFAIALVPLCIGMVCAAAYYRASAREVKRHESLLRSTVYSKFSEALTGTATIRAYGVQDQFKTQIDDSIDDMDSAYFLTFSNQRWLATRVDMVGILLVFTTSILVVTNKFHVNPSTSGVVLSYILSVVNGMQQMIRQFAEVENTMNATERVCYYGDQLEEEAPLVLNTPQLSWPEHGHIVFKNCEMRYRDGLPLILKGLNLDIAGGEKIGIVGRTGAGKSSIMTTLFRMVELSAGSIVIDGVDISTIGLHDLRKKLGILPQDPTLFRGTVRSNLDPFEEHTDHELWAVLRQSYLVDDGQQKPPTQLDEKIVNKNGGVITLDSMVEEGGMNFSQGQRQLMALARVLLRDSKIVVCDEATSSVDLETDAKIQETMVTAFAGKTVLCVAHRLRTVLRYDRICVMDDGQILELGTPRELFDIENGVFRNMCSRSGISHLDF